MKTGSLLLSSSSSSPLLNKILSNVTFMFYVLNPRFYKFLVFI